MIYYYATDGGAGTKAGTSLVNAADIDPSGTDIWTIIDALGALTDDITIYLCADATVTTGAVIAPTKAATTTYHIYVQGRNAACDADTEVTISAGTAARRVMAPTGIYWTWTDIHATDTSKAASTEAWYAVGQKDRKSVV